MNPTIKTAEKVAEELNQSNKNSGGRRAHNTQKRDWESPKITNGKATHGRVLEVQTASSVVMKTRSYGCQEEIWSRKWKWNDRAQDQALQTETESKCWLSQQFDKTIDIILGCPIFTKEQYVKKHDSVCIKLHFNICKEIEIKLDSEHWHEDVPKSIQTSHGGKVTTLWNQTGANRHSLP